MGKRIFYEPGYVFPGTYLQVIEQLPIKNGLSQVRCKCLYKDCGNEIIIIAKSLKSGNTKSCGCLHKELIAERNTKHGLMKHPLFTVWCGMKQRCYDENAKHYKRYGGRGIRMCDEWLNDFSTFHAWAIENGWEKGLVIDRIDNDGNYDPENCHFVTYAVNNRNKRNNVVLTIDGITCTIAEHAERAGLSPDIVSDRYSRLKWDIKDLLMPSKPWMPYKERRKKE